MLSAQLSALWYTRSVDKVNIRPVKSNQHWLRSTLEWLQKHNLQREKEQNYKGYTIQDPLYHKG